MKSIILSFTLKGQDLSEIKERILTIKHYIGNNVILIHGFMSRKELEKRGYSIELNDFFNEHFPVQLNMYNGGVLRKEMAEIADKLNAEIFVIGEIKGGVAEEVELYRKYNLKIIHVLLNTD